MKGSIKDLAQFVKPEAFGLARAVPAEEVVLERYTFVPYVRSGVSAALAERFGWNRPCRAALTLTLPVVAEVGPVDAEVTLTVRGPADVAGIDAGQVIRTYPPDGHTGFETEDLVHVEFDRPELPWLFTPTGPDADGRLVPWISLVVVERRADTLTAGRGGGLPVLRARLGELQRLDDAWAWAHAQVMGPKPTGPDAHKLIEDRLAAVNPTLNLSRLLCPRRLAPNRSYLACVVPTFAAGRQAGLGEDVKETTLAPAWEHGADPDVAVVVPVYYSFSFTTGESGNFEALARLLHSAKAPPGIGRRRMDASNPGNGILPLGSQDSGREQVVEGPLVSPNDPPVDAPPEFWPSEAGQRWPGATTETLRSQLNAPDVELRSAVEPVAEPNIAPPLYADQHAARSRLDGTEPSWFSALNLDPRNRVVAGLGTRVVQMDQEALMASAWNQVAGVEATNRQLRLSQFARYVGASVHRRHLQSLAPSLQLALTHRVHARVLADAGRTVRARIDDSALPASVTSGAFRRLTRARGPLARFAARSLALRAEAVSRLVAGGDGLTRDYVRRYVAPDGVGRVSPLAKTLITHALAVRVLGRDATAARQELGDRLAGLTTQPSLTDRLTPEAVAQLDLQGRGRLRGFAQGALQDLVAGTPRPEPGGDRQQALVGAGRAVLLRAFVEATARQERAWRIDVVQARRLGLAAEQPAAPDGLVEVSSESLLRLASSLDRAAGRQRVRRSIGFERGMAGRFDTMLREAPRVQGAAIAASLVKVSERLVQAGGAADVARARLQVSDLALPAKLDPALTVTARVRGRLRALPGWLPKDWFDDLRVEPVMAAPSFPFPMCEALARYDREWMMAGVTRLEPHDLVTLLETNERFVEAFLLGLNHEMARELLWRGYPTDRRGTYFKSFWTRQDELLQPIHLFGDAALGQHISQKLRGRLVLLVRGELIRRYPGVVPRAVRQHSLQSNGVPLFQAGPGAPIVFRVWLPPDVLLVGFDVLPEEVRVGDPAWWFTLSENPTEPRFGLDTGAPGSDPKRDDLTWAHLGIPDDPAARQREFLVAAQPTLQVGAVRWGRDSAAIAHLLFQLPSRAAFKGTRMLDPFKA